MATKSSPAAPIATASKGAARGKHGNLSAGAKASSKVKAAKPKPVGRRKVVVSDDDDDAMEEEEDADVSGSEYECGECAGMLQISIYTHGRDHVLVLPAVAEEESEDGDASEMEEELASEDLEDEDSEEEEGGKKRKRSGKVMGSG